jgi:hypothetical protein
MESETYSGGCLCGQVRYLARGAPVNVRVCHCAQCRQANGGLSFGRAVFLARAVTFTGATTSYASSQSLMRHACPTCGVLVHGEALDDPQRYGIGLATLDDPEALKPDMHIWVSEKPEAVNLDDGLPQYARGAPP